MTGQDDDLLRLAGGEPPRAPAPAGDAQLAAALVLQARTLEALRSAHEELLARLAEPPGRQTLANALDELRLATDRVREAQERALRRQARLRRRLLAGAALLALLLGAGVWLAARGLDDALGRARAEQGAALAELAGRLDGQQAALLARVDGLQAQRDALLGQLAGAQSRQAELEQAAAQAAGREDAALAQAQRERDLRLTSLGEAARLREQLMQRDEQLSRLAGSVAELQPPRVAPPPGTGIVPSSAAAAGLASRATAALRASGVRGESIVEAAGVADGALAGLLVMSEGIDGAAPRVRRAARGELVVRDGRPALRLVDVGDGAGTLAAEELLALPALDRAAWERLGLALPAGAVSLARLVAALDALLAPAGWRVAALEGCEGEALLGLRLEQSDAEGRVLRVLRGARALVLPGPELELRDGTLRVGADERAFYQGVYRLPLPAGDLAAFQAALRAESP